MAIVAADEGIASGGLVGTVMRPTSDQSASIGTRKVLMVACVCASSQHYNQHALLGAMLRQCCLLRRYAGLK